MTTANIDTIAASLSDCSLVSAGGNGGDRSPPHLADFIAAGEITVDLNSDTALPCHWEQRLDMRTGEIYYINWETGIETTADPRAAVAVAAGGGAPAYSSSNEEATSDEYSCVSSIGSGASYDEDDDHSDDSSSVSSASPPPPSHVLVAAGCKGCFMYFMVPKHADACPKCGGGGLLHLGRNGSI